jgi:hypothetical protein
VGFARRAAVILVVIRAVMLVGVTLVALAAAIRAVMRVVVILVEAIRAAVILRLTTLLRSMAEANIIAKDYCAGTASAFLLKSLVIQPHGFVRVFPRGGGGNDCGRQEPDSYAG